MLKSSTRTHAEVTARKLSNRSDKDAPATGVPCGDPNFGVSLLHCKHCNIKIAVPYSCKIRICPSCVNRRAEELSQSLVERLPPQGYRHIVITLPKKMGLRKRFLQDPSLYRQIGRLIHRTLSAWMANQTRCPGNGDEKERALPGIIMATQSFGDELNTHPHFRRRPPTTPGVSREQRLFRVTHPFHPLHGREFELLECHSAWGVLRAFFYDENGELRQLPADWTSLADPDPFIAVAAGRSLLHVRDLSRLADLIAGLRRTAK